MSVHSSRYAGFIDARDYGVTGDGTTDDTAAVNAVVTAAQNTVSVGVQGCDVFFPPGEMVISSTIDWTRFSGRIRGAGSSISPAYTADPGRSTVFRWNGSAGSSMFRVRDSRHISIENMRFEGKDAAKPSYAIEFNNNGGTAGSNEYMAVRDVFIGRFSWSSQGTNKGDVDSGIGFTGTNGNNDQFILENVQIYYATTYGLYIPNSQSVSGSGINCTFVGCGKGVSTGAAFTLLSPDCYNCTVDFEITGTGSLTVWDVYSENTGQWLSVGSDSVVQIYGGGTVQCGTVISGGHVLIQSSPSNTQVIELRGIEFTSMSSAANCRWEFGPNVTGSYVGNFRFVVDGCIGLDPAQLVFASGASMWAGSPLSRGVVDWNSLTGNKLHQFRNELRTAGTGGRTAIDVEAWDFPRGSTSTSADYVTKFLTGPTGSATWDPPNLGAGAEQTTTVTVTGAALGDIAECSFSLDLQGTRLVPYVSSANTVTVVHRNGTAGAVNLGSGTLRAATRRIA